MKDDPAAGGGVGPGGATASGGVATGSRTPGGATTGGAGGGAADSNEMGTFNATEAGGPGAPGSATPSGRPEHLGGAGDTAGPNIRNSGEVPITRVSDSDVKSHTGLGTAESSVGGARSDVTGGVSGGESQVRSATDVESAGSRAAEPVTGAMSSTEGTLRGKERNVSSFDTGSEMSEARATIDKPRSEVEQVADGSELSEARATIDRPRNEAEDLAATPDRLRERPGQELDDRTGDARGKASSARDIARDPSKAAADRGQREVTDAGQSKLDEAIDELDPTKKV